jgi:hypothetical protein
MSSQHCRLPCCSTVERLPRPGKRRVRSTLCQICLEETVARERFPLERRVVCHYSHGSMEAWKHCSLLQHRDCHSLLRASCFSSWPTSEHRQGTLYYCIMDVPSTSATQQNPALSQSRGQQAAQVPASTCIRSAVWLGEEDHHAGLKKRLCVRARCGGPHN